MARRRTFLLIVAVLVLAFFVGTGQKQKTGSGKGHGKPTPTATPIINDMPPTANAGSDLSCYVGEVVFLDGSASSGYATVSQTEGAWSTRWDTGDGYDIENIVKGTHVYTAAGVYTATLTVKDSSGVSSTDTATVTVTEMPDGTTVTLTDTGNAATNKTNLQSAINTAAAATGFRTIVVPAGFVANGTIYAPSRTDTTYVTVRVANADANLPVRTRVGPANAANMFKIVAADPGTMGDNYGVSLSRDSRYYRFIGMNVERSGGSSTLNDLVGVDLLTGTPGNQATHVILDRCLLNANAKPTGRGFAPNGRYFSILNSSILDIKATGVESKAIGQWDGEGPLGVINNRLDAASINVIIGGVDMTADSSILKGYVFRGNYSWKDPAWAGVYGVKNLWEMKYGHFAVCVGNIFENNYVDGQAGEAIVLKSATQGDNAAPYNEVRQVDFRDNKVLNTRAGFNVINIQEISSAPFPPYANHIRFYGNLFTEHNTGSGRGELLQAPEYFELIHNTFISPTKGQVLAISRGGNGLGGVDPAYQAPGLKLLNNLFYQTDTAAFRADDGTGTTALNTYYSSWDVRGNVVPPVSSSATYPASNSYPASYYSSDFENYAGGDYRLKTTSTYHNAATDGTDIGADMTTLNAATSTVVSGTWAVSGGGEAAPPVFYRLTA